MTLGAIAVRLGAEPYPKHQQSLDAGDQREGVLTLGEVAVPRERINPSVLKGRAGQYSTEAFTAVVLNVWPLDQQHLRHLGTC